MPIYEFKCADCGLRFEELCKMGDTSSKVCPRCAGNRVSRVFSLFAARSSSGEPIGGGSRCGPCSSGNCSTCH